MDIESLKRKARWVRHQVLEMIISAGKGHMGGSFSCVEILLALYQGGVLRVDPGNVRSEGRDRFILSKGHSAEALYAVLADCGFFPVSELATYGKGGSRLGGHVDNKIPGVEVSTGSLGHGLGLAAGLALCAKMDQRDYLTVVLLGDGECYEGSIWEAVLFAAHQGLNNLVAIIDRNQQITLNYTEDCIHLEPLDEKWRAFGWDTAVVNGHAFEEILRVMRDIHFRKSQRPLVIIASTVKGKGVSFMEGQLQWHHNVPKGEKLEVARKELSLASDGD